MHHGMSILENWIRAVRLERSLGSVLIGSFVLIGYSQYIRLFSAETRKRSLRSDGDRFPEARNHVLRQAHFR